MALQLLVKKTKRHNHHFWHKKNKNKNIMKLMPDVGWHQSCNKLFKVNNNKRTVKNTNEMTKGTRLKHDTK